MADTSFNYSTRAFQQHAAHPGFWHYALRVSSSRFVIRLDGAEQPVALAA